ncbi:MAG: hypothetical protein QXP59_05330 [Saccharolobus sp.]
MRAKDYSINLPGEFVTSIDMKIESLISKISPISENRGETIIGRSLNENYTAFFNNKKKSPRKG